VLFVDRDRPARGDGAASGSTVGAVVPGVNVIEGAAVGAPIGGLAGAVWADQNNDGYVDGYVANGQYYTGTPQGYDPTLRRVATGALGGAAIGGVAGAVIPGISVLEGAVIGAAVGGLAGAIWADRDNDGRVDGYVYNGQYYQGGPGTALATSSTGRQCDAMPTLSLEPPQPSAPPLTLSNRLFVRQDATLGSVANDLVQALQANGYQEQSFYCVAGGFALATAVERIRSDKTSWPGDARWNLARVPLVDLSEGFSLGRILGALINADPGSYRMIVFYVTDRQVTPGRRQPSSDFRNLPTGGPDELSRNVSRWRYGSNYRVRALVYEFHRRSVSSPAYFVSATLPTAIHLRRSGILRTLER